MTTAESGKEPVTVSDLSRRNQTTAIQQSTRQGLRRRMSETFKLSPIEQLDALMKELLALQDLVLESGSPNGKPSESQMRRRDPDEVDAFWHDIRTRLWIGEDEIYPGVGEQSDLAEKNMENRRS
jgi:hypothetical protein